jgi:hypothetical protein
MMPEKSRCWGIRNVRNGTLLSCTLHTLHSAITSFGGDTPSYELQVCEQSPWRKTLPCPEHDLEVDREGTPSHQEERS